ncbi:dihydrofolate reductase [uncultured Mobiluncus sp.]|uniref:dihydrofolate reductase n=1 Tax=uncultured Mobiluncus sp. TaxID=293425 RepID=UPI00262FC9A0|nr:dihydrofolate reductase [uncultured Mobiluncus sp.]
MVGLNPGANQPVHNPYGWTPPVCAGPTPLPEGSPSGSRAGHGIGVLGMIWAEDKAQVLGAGGKMLWHVPADFKHFKDTTMGSPVIMGRASFLSLGQALPGRRNIVLTGSREFTAPDVEVAHSLTEALELCANTPQVWITGGAKVYREVMELGLADLLVVTQLDMTAIVPPMSTVAYAPVIDPVRWQLDLTRSDENWRPKSGDAAWRVRYYIPR